MNVNNRGLPGRATLYEKDVKKDVDDQSLGKAFFNRFSSFAVMAMTVP